MKIIMERGKVWEAAEVSSQTIALDGAIQGPVIDNDRKVYSFDHHANVVRHVTTATCQQVLDALLLGLDPQGFDILVNDVDGDTVLSVWLLKQAVAHDSISEWVSIGVTELVEVVSKMDAHGPAYPRGHRQAVADQFYQGVMLPESSARRNRTYGDRDLMSLLDECLSNLDSYFGGKIFPVKDMDVPFTVTHTHEDFVIVTSEGFAFGSAYKAGHQALVAYTQLPDGSYAYTVGKKSEFVANFNVPAILTALNAKEPGWGGSSTIGGAPRNADGSRSHLQPDEIFAIIKDVVRA